MSKTEIAFNDDPPASRVTSADGGATAATPTAKPATPPVPGSAENAVMWLVGDRVLTTAEYESEFAKMQATPGQAAQKK